MTICWLPEEFVEETTCRAWLPARSGAAWFTGSGWLAWLSAGAGVQLMEEVMPSNSVNRAINFQELMQTFLNFRQDNGSPLVSSLAAQMLSRSERSAFVDALSLAHGDVGLHCRHGDRSRRGQPRSSQSATLGSAGRSCAQRPIVRSGATRDAVVNKKRTSPASFKQSLLPILAIGVLLSLLFFAAIISGPLNSDLLRRYCLNHPVAIACIALFFVGLVTLALKWLSSFRQQQLFERASSALRNLTLEGNDVAAQDRPSWLDANWRALPASIAQSWYGRRIQTVVELQRSRGKRHQLEADLKHYAEQEEDRQHESYSLLRIINWAMPMLGFLGTVLGISQTLGQLDTERLATQQQQAMNELTAGLYVAFDTTATALILTVVLMFIQFAISRLEQGVLSQITDSCQQLLVPFAGGDLNDSEASLLAPVREMTETLISELRQLTLSQSETWRETMDETHRQWTLWMQHIASEVDTALGASLHTSLETHVVQLQKLQAEADSQFGARVQQWQTSLSQQARQTLAQQQEISSQYQTLDGLLQGVNQLTLSIQQLAGLDNHASGTGEQLQKYTKLEEAAQSVAHSIDALNQGLKTLQHQQVLAKGAEATDASDVSFGAKPGTVSKASTNASSIKPRAKLAARKEAQTPATRTGASKRNAPKGKAA